MTGVIKSFNPKHGYGFIEGNIFFHIRDWNLRVPPVEGLEVSYELEQTTKGVRAVKLKGVREHNV